MPPSLILLKVKVEPFSPYICRRTLSAAGEKTKEGHFPFWPCFAAFTLRLPEFSLRRPGPFPPTQVFGGSTCLAYLVFGTYTLPRIPRAREQVRRCSVHIPRYLRSRPWETEHKEQMAGLYSVGSGHELSRQNKLVIMTDHVMKVMATHE